MCYLISFSCVWSERFRPVGCLFWRRVGRTHSCCQMHTWRHLCLLVERLVVGFSWTMKSGINPECAAVTSWRCGLIHSKRVSQRISSLNLRLACYLQAVFNFLEFQKEQRLPKLCLLHKMGHMNKEVNFLCFVLPHYFFTDWEMVDQLLSWSEGPALE